MRKFVQAWREAFRKRRLLIYATAIAMRAFVRQDAKGNKSVGVARRVF